MGHSFDVCEAKATPAQKKYVLDLITKDPGKFAAISGKFGLSTHPHEFDVAALDKKQVGKIIDAMTAKTASLKQVGFALSLLMRVDPKVWAGAGQHVYGTPSSNVLRKMDTKTMSALIKDLKAWISLS